MNLNIPYQKPLVIGTGGGNDIVSATLIVAHLREQGINADLSAYCTMQGYDAKEIKNEKFIQEQVNEFTLLGKSKKRILRVAQKVADILDK